MTSPFHTDDSQELQKEYEGLLEKLHMMQTAWHKAASRKIILESSANSTVSQWDVLEPIMHRISELQGENALLNQQNKFLQSQLKDAKELYKRTCEESKIFTNDLVNEKKLLEEDYMQAMRLVDQFDPELQEDAALVKAALAEQRVEIRVLQEVIEAVKQSMLYDSQKENLHSSSSLFPPPSPLIEVAVDKVQIPVPHGKLRLLTGPRGDGLQQLRDKYKVAVFIVNSKDTVAVRVQGHVNGVENCVHDIRHILSL